MFANATNCIAGRQLDWLREDLNAHRDAGHIFAFVHKPLWENWPSTGREVKLAVICPEGVLSKDTSYFGEIEFE